MQLRRATMEDMYEMQHCNLLCLPENYNLRYFYYHMLSWPQLLYVQQDYNGNTVGYVMGKMDDEESAEKKHGHVTSLAVLRSHRKLGVASRVMRATMAEMDGEYGGHYCSLHVRKTNDAALHLYQDTLKFRCAGVEERYYVDEEDAYHMKHYFHEQTKGSYIDENKHMVRDVPGASAPVKNAAGTGAEEKDGGKKAAGGAKLSAKELQSEMAKLLEELGEAGGGDGKGAKGAKHGGGGGKKGKGKK